MSCGKCGGKGWVNERVQGGVCFRCDGLGDEIKARELRKKRNEKNNQKWIIELKEIIAGSYKKINKPRLIGGDSRRAQIRKEAATANKILKEKFNIILSLEEIVEIADGLEEISRPPRTLEEMKRGVK